jgi:flagellar motor switch/type III secretory pathway protein FliN
MAEQRTTPDTKAASPGTPSARRTGFSAIPLVLSARLATGTAPLLDLRSVAPGGLVHLETPVGEPARLMAGGAVIAAGEIVETKGRLALRVTRLGSDDD